MKAFRIVLTVFCILCISILTCFADSSDDPQEAFDELVEELQSQGIIPSSGAELVFSDDNYENEWAQINWYQWMNFDNSQHFLFFSDISFNTPASTPNFSESGCGVVFADGDTVYDGHLTATVRMDGSAWLYGTRRGTELSYGHYPYARAHTKGTHRFAVVQDGNHVMVYVDDALIMNKSNIVTDMGSGVGLVTMSGTNKGYGTRCTYEHIYYMKWD